MDAFKLILVSLAGWMNRQQQHVIKYLKEEFKVLKEQQGSRRQKFTDGQRRRLARKAKLIRYGRLKEIVGLVAPQAHSEEIRFQRRPTQSRSSADPG